MIEETSKDVYLAVNWAVSDVVNGTKRQAVFWAIFWAVEGAVGGIMDRAVDIAVRDTRYPGLQEFLHSCGAEVEV